MDIDGAPVLSSSAIPEVMLIMALEISILFANFGCNHSVVFSPLNLKSAKILVWAHLVVD